MSSFKAYIGVDEYELKSGSGNGAENGFDAKSELKLLPGEVVISSAEGVLKFAALSQQRRGILGALFVTNFKISFVTADKASFELVDRSFQNNYLGECDVCLANIDSIYQVYETGSRKKKLLPGSNISSRLQVVEIHCKDFRIHTFSFKFNTAGQEKAVINAILHHAYPPRVQLLFAFEYKGPVTKGHNVAGTRLFSVASDWQHELQRLRCDHKWRVSHLNENYMISKSLPETFVVPSSLLDEQLNKAAPHFYGNRVPTWSWSNSDGCAIVRSTKIHPGISDSPQMGIMLDFLKTTHPRKQKPYLVDLDEILPSVKDLEQSYIKLRELCMPESGTQFWEQDSRFYSQLENSKWLWNIAQYLGVAKELAAYIYRNNAIVVLQETEGRDLNCLISSLIQLVLDPHYRSITGFQSLIQKEWVAMGHQFADRHKLLRNTENEEAPVFWVFLDCTWQILQQFPSAFEFTEIYLTTLWDCTLLTTFDTFLFNSCWNRWAATRERPNPLQTRSLWDWSVLLSKEEIALFRNPLYIISQIAAETLSAEAAINDRSTIQRKSPQDNVKLRQGLHPFSLSQTRKSKSIESDTSPITDLPPKRPASMIKQLSTTMLSTDSKVPAPLARWKLYRTLPVNTRLYALQIWSHCYFRWIPLAQIVGGGSPVVYIERCHLVKDIVSLQKKINSFSICEKGPAGQIRDSLYSFLSSSHNSRINVDVITSAFPYAPGGSPSTYGLPAISSRQSNYIPSDDELEAEYSSLQGYNE